MSLLLKNGIKGPCPHFIMGNINDLPNLSTIEKQKIWIQKYGKIMGYYVGPQPVVLVADTKLAQRIQLGKYDFKQFMNKMPDTHQFDSWPYLGQNILISRDEKWQRIRKLLVPVFSNLNLKDMTLKINNSFKQFFETNLKEKVEKEEEFDFRVLIQKLTLDILVNTCFGSHSKNIIKKLKELEEYPKTGLSRFLYLIHIYFPKLFRLRQLEDLVKYYLNLTPVRFLYIATENIIKERHKNLVTNKNDLLQVMLNSKLTTNEIISNSLLFYIGGFETLSNSLAFIVHNLVNNEDIQQRIRNEVKKVFDDNQGKLDLNACNRLHYMETVIKESLRISPPLHSSTSRVCQKDYKFGHFIIPKGAMIQIATYHLHHDPDYWDNPSKFDPDRFNNERKNGIPQCLWQPFGDGPRNCLGKQFALLQIKLILSNLLLKYRFKPTEHTERGPLSVEIRTFSIKPKNGVLLKLTKL